MPKLKQPSIRARKYIKNKIAGMSDYQAAIKAGYSSNTALAAVQNIEKPMVKETMAQMMDRMGLTDERLHQHLMDGLENANKIHGYNDNFVEVPDYSVRHRYLETAYKLKDKFPTQKMDLAIGGQDTINRWKKEMGIDEQSLSSVPEVDTDGIQEESLPVPDGDSPEDTESLPLR